MKCACRCGRVVPGLALKHGDWFATTRCAKRAYGVLTGGKEEQPLKAPQYKKQAPFVINPERYRRRVA